MTYFEILNIVEIEIIPVPKTKKKFINLKINDCIHVYFDDDKFISSEYSFPYLCPFKYSPSNSN